MFHPLCAVVGGGDEAVWWLASGVRLKGEVETFPSFPNFDCATVAAALSWVRFQIQVWKLRRYGRTMDRWVGAGEWDGLVGWLVGFEYISRCQPQRDCKLVLLKSLSRSHRRLWKRSWADSLNGMEANCDVGWKSKYLDDNVVAGHDIGRTGTS